VPDLSVVIPVRNAADTLGDQLAALAEQAGDVDWELVVADNGSTDASRAVAGAWQDRLPLVLVDASSVPGAGPAKNIGAAAARADRLAFIDADDIVAPGYLSAMCRALGQHPLVAGAVDAERLNRPEHVAARGLRARDRPPRAHRFMEYAMGCNTGARREVFVAVSGFRPYVSAHDVDFSWRAQLAGYPLAFEAGALVHYRLRDTPRGAWHQGLSYRDGPALFRAFRHQGMPRSSFRDAAGDAVWLLAHVPALRDPDVRYAWAYKAGIRAARISESVRQRAIFL
jgi:glycosyltransferase involved in cell wall biosynthesis